MRTYILALVVITKGCQGINDTYYGNLIRCDKGDTLSLLIPFSYLSPEYLVLISLLCCYSLVCSLDYLVRQLLNQYFLIYPLWEWGGVGRGGVFGWETCSPLKFHKKYELLVLCNTSN